MNRRLLLAAVVLFAGCASDGPYEPPRDVRLQDPLPGKGIIYLLRAPHDSAAVQVSVDGRQVATLPSSTYTLISLAPGQYSLTTASASDRSQLAPPFVLDVRAGTRRFLNLSGRTRESAKLEGLIPIGSGVVPLVTPSIATRDGRSWKEVTELDAQGLMSIARLVLPERAAL